jgi:hypothetical protein
MSSDKKRRLNLITLGIFAPVLVLAGALGFLIPPHLSLTSSAPAYNVFHIVSGTIGIALVWLKKDESIRLFNLGFGAIDLYQALASFLHLFPEQYFRWTRIDDVLHIIIGIALLLIGWPDAKRSRGRNL